MAKKILLLTVFVLFSSTSFAQQISKKHLNDNPVTQRSESGRSSFGLPDIEENTVNLFFANRDIGKVRVPWVIKTGDYNNDGYPDIFTAGFNSDSLIIFPGNGDGSFSNAIFVDSLDRPITLDANDYNNDGYTDISTTDFGKDQIIVYLNSGSGTYPDSTIISANTDVDGIFTMHSDDFTGNGYNDILVGSIFDDKVSYYPNNGDGTFGSQSVVTTSADSVLSVTSADLDNDGDNDILYASANNNKIAWHSNQGSGNFASENIISTDVSVASYVTAGDVNDDGFPDVVAASEGSHSVYLFLNNGNGTFADPVTISNNLFYAVNVQITDINLDGNQDIVAAAFGSNKIAWYPGNGDGTFGDEFIVSELAYGVQGMAISDLDGDQDPDILSAHYNSGEIEWHENLSANNTSITINEIRPRAAAPAQTVVIHGIGFSTTASNNEVYFGNNRAIVASATATRLVVEVPDATTENTSVFISNSNGTATFADRFTILKTEPFELLPATESNSVSNTATGVEDVVAADLDGDGDLDLVAADYTDDNISWYENLGNGSFSDEIILDNATNAPRSVTAVDIDSDGDLDIIAAVYGDNDILLYENNGDGTFSGRIYIDSNINNVYDLHAADMNADGHVDILTASYNGTSAENNITLYINNGSGSFPSVTSISTTFYYATGIDAADIDNDGDLDIVVSSSIYDKVSSFNNNGDGTFASETIHTSTTDGIESFTMADLNGDGYLDILTASRVDDDISWFPNNGNGTFGSEIFLDDLASDGWDVSAGDMDGDGDLDVLVALGGNENYIAWYENTGSGNFASEILIDSQISNPRSVLAADMDGDGDLDVISGAYSNGTIEWYENIYYPRIGKITPLSGAAGERVTIYGENLTDPRVEFGNVQATIISENENRLVVEVPEGVSGEAIITVYNRDASREHRNPFAVLRRTSPAFETGSIVTSQITDPRALHTADLNGDGLSDLVSASSTDDRIAWYPNNGDGTYGAQNTITTLADGAWDVTSADIDNDGDLDIISASFSDDKIAWYQNNGSGGFGTQQVISQLTAGARSVETLDVDRDGNIDIVTASTNDNTIAWYQNNGDNTFQSEQIIDNSATGAWDVFAIDLNNDGYEDIVAAASTADQVLWYKNNGDSTFETAQIVASDADGVRSVYAGDLNNDGYADIVSGSLNNDEIAVHINDGSEGFFADSTIITDSDGVESVYLGDVNGDGNLDILAASSVDNTLAWYQGNGDGTFGTQELISITASVASAVIATDVDSDGDLDVVEASPGNDNIFLHYNTGAISELNVTQVTPNAAASGAKVSIFGTGFSTTASENTVTFSGATGTVESATATKLVVEVPVASAGFKDISVSNGDETEEYVGDFSLLKNIDFSYEYSDASDVLEGVYYSSSSFGDVNGDGYLDLIVTGRNNNSTYISTLYINDGNGNFSESSNSFEGVYLGSSSFADVDSDGDLDLIITGLNNSSSSISTLYVNDGNGNFSESGNSFEGVYQGSSSFADVDSDGDLDLILTGISNSGYISNLYTNDGSGNFSYSEVSLEGVSNGSSSFGDVNGDGYLDLIVTGRNNSSTYISTLYINNGNGNFSESSNSLEGVYQGSSSFSDVDSDGDLDLILTGLNSNSTYISTLYVNDGNGDFSESGNSFEGVRYGSTSFGDIDGDGDIDLLITGLSNSSTYLSTLYINDGSGSFSDSETSIEGIYRGSSSFADIDGDADLDLVITGYNGSTYISYLYENTGTPPAVEITSISDARSLETGTEVNIRGIITREAPNLFKIQEDEAGMHLYNSEDVNSLLYNSSVTVGDSIQVSGSIGDFDGMIELTDISAVQILSSDNPLPEPIELDLSTITNFEPYESVLVRAVGLSTDSTGSNFLNKTNYPLSQNGSDVDISLYVADATLTEVAGLNIPSTFEFTGIIYQGVIESQNTYALYPMDSADVRETAPVNPIAIEDAKSLEDSALVRVRGIVTSPNFRPESRTDFYIQDRGVAINVFNFGTPIKQVTVGDSVEVVGRLETFNSLREIVVDNIDEDITILNSGNTLPEPREITFQEFQSAADTSTDALNLQGLLVRVNGLTTDPDTWPANSSASSTNVTVTDFDNNDYTVRLIQGTEAVEITPPTYLDLIGILGTFNGSQLYPRFESDVIELDAPGPQNLTLTVNSSSIDLSWEESPLSSMDGYNVYRSTSAFTDSTNATKLNSSILTSTSFTDNTVEDNNRYFYRVSAIDTDNNEVTSLSNQAVANFYIYSIYSVSQTFGVPENSITLYGTNLSATTSDYSVQIGNTSATVTAATSNRVTVEIPSLEPGNYTLSVALNGDQISVHELFTVIEDEANQSGFFQDPSYLSQALPGISRILPVDIDGDADYDILGSSLNSTSSVANIFSVENTGVSSFSAVRNVVEAGDVRARNVASADFDGDEDLDVAAVYDRSLVWYSNNGDGTYSRIQNSTIALFESSENYGIQNLVAFDVDRDGSIDLVHSDRIKDDITYYRNNGNGSFSQQQFIDGNAPLVNFLYTADTDNDGDLDLLASLEGNDRIVTYFNNNGTFGSASISTTSVDSPQAIALYDLDQDGDLDLITASKDDNKIAWSSNSNSSGAFTGQTVITLQIDNPISISLADLNGDNQIDLLIGTEDGDLIWLEGEGSGNFASAQTILSGLGQIRAITAADFTNDGTMDILAGDYTNNDLIFIRNVDTPPSAPTGVSIASSIGSISLSWNQNSESDIQGYDVLRSTEEDGAFNSILSNLTTQTSYTDSDITNGQTYYYKVVVVDESNTRVESSVVSATAISTQISSIEPLYGAAGSTVLIRGVFAENSTSNTVEFGSAEATIQNSTSSALWVEVPSGAPERSQITVTSESVEASYPADFTKLTQNDGSFTPPLTSAGYSGSGNVVATDVDGDGFGDLVVTRTNFNQIRMLFSDGDDPYSRTLNFGYPSTINPSVIRAINLGGENYPDFVFISNQDNQFRVLRNNGGATSSTTFMDQSIISVNHTTLTDITAADMDGDGLDDVIISSSGDNRISWYANQTTENTIAFGSENNITQSASGVSSVYAADFNNDGLIDVAAALTAVDDVVVYVNNGNGSFSTNTLTGFGDVSDPVKVFAADLDNDGDMDILSASNGDVLAFENDGNGSFSIANISSSIGDVSDVIAADVNGDGQRDILATSGNNDSYYWFQNNGNFSFGNATQLPGSINNPQALIAYDMDQNGQLDVVVRAQGDGTLNVSRNMTVTGIQVQSLNVANQQVSVNHTLELNFNINFDDFDNAADWFQNAIQIVNDEGEETSPTLYTIEGSTLTITNESNLFALDTLFVSISAETINENSNGQVYLDANENDIFDADEGEYNSPEFYTTLIGDFDLDFDVDFDDLLSFRDGWVNEDYFYETAPINFSSNATFPNAYFNPDGDFNIDDLVAFIRYWNFSQDLNEETEGEEQEDGQLASKTQKPETQQSVYESSEFTGLNKPSGNSGLQEDQKEESAETQSIASLPEEMEFISYTKKETGPTYVSNPNAAREITYTLSLDYPDSVVALSLQIDFDESVLNIADIENHELFNIKSENANVFLSHVDSTQGLLTLNIANLQTATSIQNRDIVSLTFNSKVDEDSEIIIQSDLRAQGRPALKQIARKAVAIRSELPETFALSQNYPNPFNPTTTIHYELAEQSRVNVTVYDILGRQVETLLNESNIRPGYYKLGWDASRYASGMYIYVMNVQTAKGKHHMISKKMLLVK